MRQQLLLPTLSLVPRISFLLFYQVLYNNISQGLRVFLCLQATALTLFNHSLLSNIWCAHDKKRWPNRRMPLKARCVHP